MPGPVTRRPQPVDHAWLNEALTVDYESYQSLRTDTNRSTSGMAELVRVSEALMTDWRRRMDELRTIEAESILNIRRGLSPFSYWWHDEKPTPPKDPTVVNLLADPKDRA